MNVEAATGSVPELAWFKSSYSGAEGGQCVEVAACPEAVHVRDSKDKEGLSCPLPLKVGQPS